MKERKQGREEMTKEGRKENIEVMYHQFHNRRDKEIYPQKSPVWNKHGLHKKEYKVEWHPFFETTLRSKVSSVQFSCSVMSDSLRSKGFSEAKGFHNSEWRNYHPVLLHTIRILIKECGRRITTLRFPRYQDLTSHAFFSQESTQRERVWALKTRKLTKKRGPRNQVSRDSTQSPGRRMLWCLCRDIPEWQLWAGLDRHPSAKADDSDLQEGNTLEKQLSGTFNFIANCSGKLLETMERMSDQYETHQMTNKVCEHQD